MKPKSDQRRRNRGYAEPMTREQVDSLLAEDWLRELVADIRNGHEEKKALLPFICPHYAEFKNNHRAQADIIPEAFTHMTCVDVDDLALVDKAIEGALALNADEYSEWNDQVLRIAYSARKKVHIYLRLLKGKTIEETQRLFCKELGVPYDESCITPERFIYVTGKDEEVFRSPHWLEPLSEEELTERREAYLERGMDIDGRRTHPHDPNGPSFRSPRGEEKKTPSPLPLNGEDGQVSDVKCQSQPSMLNVQSSMFNAQSSMFNAQCSERTRFIFDECMRECELEPEVLVVEGGRHEAVKCILSVGASQLLTKEEFLGVLSERMPDNWQDENIRTLVNDFYAKYHDPSQKMTQFQRRVFAKSRKLENERMRNGENEKMRNGENEGMRNGEISDSADDVPLGDNWRRLRSAEEQESSMFNVQSLELPKRLPRLIKLLTSKTPDIYKPAVAHAVFPPLATHLCNVRFRYTDNVEHEATLMNCLMASTGAGKGCTDEPIARIMADIKLRDKENERREAEWKKDCQKKGANKDKLLRPEGLVIQIIDPDMTKPALVTRMDEAEGHFVYVKLNELDLFEQLKGQTGKQHFQLMCLAFDPGAEYGQTRVGTQSVTARPQCRFNWNASTTIVKGRRFFRNVLTDGPISRINFCTIPEQEIGCEQPIYGTYDAGFDEQLRPYIENLCAARGLIDCPQAFRLAKRLQQECAEFARLSQDETYWNLSHRACVIAWLKACVLYVANGQKWESAIEDFVRWSLNYDLWCKMQFFGEDIDKANRENERRGKRGPRNLLELLPHEFTIEDAKRVRREQGLSNEGNLCRQMISQWAFRKYVLQITDYSFVKNKK